MEEGKEEREEERKATKEAASEVEERTEEEKELRVTLRRSFSKMDDVAVARIALLLQKEQESVTLRRASI